MHITQPSALSQFVYIEEERLLKCIINQTKESSVFTAYYAPSYIYHTYHSRVPKKSIMRKVYTMCYQIIYIFDWSKVAIVHRCYANAVPKKATILTLLKFCRYPLYVE